MSRKKIIPDMVDLYLQGMTPRRIGELYGVSASSVGDRLKRRGYPRPFRQLRSISAIVDKNRLETLYAKERLSYERIAAELGISVKVIPKALEFYSIPKRAMPDRGGQYLGLLRRLRIGESAEILYRDQNQIAPLRQSAKTLGIFIAVQSEDENRLKVSRIAEDEIGRLSAIADINRGQLEELYSERKLSPARIGRQLGYGAELINQALDFYLIPRRLAGGTYNGKYTNVFKKLKVGETCEVECAAKYPHNNLHTISARLGMKISMRKVAEKRYKITRLL